MQLLSDHREIDWIEIGKSPANPWIADATWKGATVSHLIPPIFPAYAKLFHPIYEDLSIVDREISWNRSQSPSAVDQWPLLEIVATSGTLVYGGAEAAGPFQSVSWRELTERYGLDYTPTLNVSSFSRRFPDGSWPRYLIGPSEGDLEDQTRDALADCLAMGSKNTDCFFYFASLATKGFQAPLLYRGRLSRVSAFATMTDRVHVTPTYWFPPDHDWLVSTDYDLPFTLIGGPATLISRLIAEESLECVPVTPEMRIDFRSDIGNMLNN